MQQNKVYLSVLVILIIGIVGVAWQVTSSQRPVLEMPAQTAEPSTQVSTKEVPLSAPKPVQQPQPPAQPKQSPAPEPLQSSPATTQSAPPSLPQSAQSTPASATNHSLLTTPTNEFVEEVVIISDADFSPKQVNIQAGQSIRWEYPKGSRKHMLSFRNSQLRSTLLSPGQSWTHQFNDSDELDYIDAVFPYMNGKVVVG